MPLIVGVGAMDNKLSTTRGYVNGKQVEVLRDIGCTGVVVKQCFVQPHQVTGDKKRCVLMDRTVRVCPVANIEIESPYFSGIGKATCMQDAICDLIVGSIQGAKLRVSDADDEGKPVCEGHVSEGTSATPGKSELSNPPTDPVSTVTVERVAEASVEESEASTPTPTRETSAYHPVPYDDYLPFMETIQREVSQPDVFIGVVETRAKRKKSNRLKPLSVSNLGVTTENNVPINLEEQETDETLKCLITGTQGRKIKLVKSNGLWVRVKVQKWGEEVKQVLLPTTRREYVLALAHESLMGGHLGVKKAQDRVLSSFFWPGVSRDVKRWVNSCDQCHRTIPKGKVTKGPLGRMPLMNVPFQRVAMDLVGPISPPSSQGNRWVLTLVDYATRWPEAVALSGIETERVAEALLSIFSRLGFPREILSDRGSQFTSDLMHEVCR